jgi:hypothetical protein
LALALKQGSLVTLRVKKLLNGHTKRWKLNCQNKRGE